jgi:hypothetical protein
MKQFLFRRSDRRRALCPLRDRTCGGRSPGHGYSMARLSGQSCGAQRPAGRSGEPRLPRRPTAWWQSRLPKRRRQWPKRTGIGVSTRGHSDRLPGISRKGERTEQCLESQGIKKRPAFKKYTGLLYGRRSSSERIERMLPSRVRFLEEVHDRLVVFEHCLRAQIFAGLFAQHLPPVLARARPHDALQEIPDLLVARIVAVARVLVEDIPGDIVVQVELQDARESIVIVLCSVVVDVRLRCRGEGGTIPWYLSTYIHQRLLNSSFGRFCS